MLLWLALSGLLILALLAYVVRLRDERQRLRREIGRVLRAGAGRVESQEVELRWYHALCQNVPHPLMVTDAHKTIRYMNPAAMALFGPFQPGEAAIQRLRDHHLEYLLDEALARGDAEPQGVELHHRLFLAIARPWLTVDNEPGGVTLFLQDVSELTRLARARRDMAANLSHELRTPLASVKLMTETLLNGAMEEPTLGRQLVTRIATENDALIRLVEDLTALNWIERGRTPLRLEQSNLRELVEWRLQRLAPQQEEKQIRFELDSPPAPLVLLDPERFGQVLTNLLDNAIKFSPVGGTIFITIIPTADETTLTIRDEGPGILPTELPRIFERFYKGDRARTRTPSTGTGLGLAIVKHLVEAHGGTVRAANHPQHGAVFTVTLPSE